MPGLVGWGVMAEPEKERFQGLLPTACLRLKPHYIPYTQSIITLFLPKLSVPKGVHPHGDIACPTAWQPDLLGIVQG